MLSDRDFNIKLEVVEVIWARIVDQSQETYNPVMLVFERQFLADSSRDRDLSTGNSEFEF